MDLHVYRNSQDRWHDLRFAARERGAILAVNALTLDELVGRITPDLATATQSQRFVITQKALHKLEAGNRQQETQLSSEVLCFLLSGLSVRYLYEAIAELKCAQVRPSELRSANVVTLGEILEGYDNGLRTASLYDPQDRCSLAASRVKEGGAAWLKSFHRLVLHALYDLTEAEFNLVQSIIEFLPDGGSIVLFNATTNVKPTQFAEWTWQRFVRDEALAERTFPEFCRSSNPTRAVLDRLFVFESGTPLPPDDSLKIIEASGRYNEIEIIAGDIADLMASGESSNDVAVVVRHIEDYGEMLEDVFSRYGIPHIFETGVPLLRVPFVKYWLALLDLVTGDRSREALSRVMSSAYYQPRLSPRIDVEKILASIGYIDRHHLPASALASRRQSSLTSELQRFEKWLDDLQKASDSVAGFLSRLQPTASLTERDRQAWRILVEELEAVNTLELGKGGRATDKSDEQIPFVQFRKIASEIPGFRTVPRLSTASAIPGLSCVRIMSPYSLGHRTYRWIFSPGFVDGEFPARSLPNPLLPDDTIQAVNSRIKPRRILTSADRSRREPLYLFMILDSGTQRVTLTYPGNTLEGETMHPSVYVREIARHYEQSPVIHFSPRGLKARAPISRAEGEWRNAVADEWRAGSISDGRALELLGKGIVERVHLERKGIARADLGQATSLLDGVWHPTELNALNTCPFVFLSRHRLKLRIQEPPDYEVRGIL